MPVITGLNTGQVNVQSIVSQLMAVEQKPINDLNTKSASYQTQLSVLGGFKSSVASFQTAVKQLGSAGSFNNYSVTSGDSSVFTASASSTAPTGTYAISVSSLAQSQQLIAEGQASSTATIGSGATTTLSFDFGTISYDPLNGGSLDSNTGKYTGANFNSSSGGVKTVTIDNSNNTLAGIRDAINNANIGVSATIVNDGGTSPYRLALSSTATGISNSLSISVTGDAAISSLLSNDPTGTQNLSQTLEAKNANFTLNGIPITKTSNTVTDAIQGVTLNLNGISTSPKPTNLTISTNTAAISSAVSSFITAYNSLYSSLGSVSAYKTSSSSGGSLPGDPAIRQLMGEMRNLISGSVAGGGLTTLASAGITSQPGVGLVLDSAKFNAALSNNLADLTNLFASSNGIATNFDAWAKSSINVTLANRTSTISKNISSIADQVATRTVRLASIQKRYTAQFTSLNTILASLSNLSSSITGTLG